MHSLLSYFNLDRSTAIYGNFQLDSCHFNAIENAILRKVRAYKYRNVNVNDT